jgi:hypothetical protein
MDKSTKLRDLAASLPAIAGIRTIEGRNSSSISFSKRADADHTHTKSSRLKGILANTKAEVSSHRGKRRPVQCETVVMAGGWYHTGFPKQTVYRVEDLVQFWRACMVQHYRQQTPPLPFQWYLRPKVLEWLRADGHQICEKVVAYAVRMWEPLKEEFEIEAEHPTMNVIWGFRRVLYKRMMQTGEKRRWGAHWNGEAESAEYIEAVS